MNGFCDSSKPSSTLVGRERTGEIVVNPPPIGACVRIEADGQEASAWLENTSTLAIDIGVIGKVVERVDTEDPLEHITAPR